MFLEPQSQHANRKTYETFHDVALDLLAGNCVRTIEYKARSVYPLGAAAKCILHGWGCLPDSPTAISGNHSQTKLFIVAETMALIPSFTLNLGASGLAMPTVCFESISDAIVRCAMLRESIEIKTKPFPVTSIKSWPTLFASQKTYISSQVDQWTSDTSASTYC